MKSLFKIDWASMATLYVETTLAANLKHDNAFSRTDIMVYTRIAFLINQEIDEIEHPVVV